MEKKNYTLVHRGQPNSEHPLYILPVKILNWNGHINKYQFVNSAVCLHKGHQLMTFYDLVQSKGKVADRNYVGIWLANIFQ